MGKTDKLAAITTYPVYKKKDLFNFYDLMGVIDGKVAALRIPNFCSQEICREVSMRILKYPKKSNFNKAKDIGSIGMAHFNIDGPEANEIYHQNAISNTQMLREIFSPFLSPVDKLRLSLEEIWPAGANLELLYGKKCFVGICRIMEPTIELLAHNDRLDRDSPDSLQAKSLLGQLSACIYLQVPSEGGGLRLWMSEPCSEDEYEKLKDGSYGIATEKLGNPIHVIEPQQGELVIFNIRKLHGVAPGKGNPRINVGAFIGYRGVHQPLSYWS